MAGRITGRCISSVASRASWWETCWGYCASPRQSLARVLTALVEQGLVAMTPGRHDRRQRLLTLTDAGRGLERRLFKSQRERLASAYREAGGPAVDGFRRVMRGIMDQPARTALDQATPPGPPYDRT